MNVLLQKKILDKITRYNSLMTISIFGSEFYKKDQGIVKHLANLKKALPHYTWLYQDPSEDLVIPTDDWWILDIAMNISKPLHFHDLSKFQKTKSLSAHDYDLWLELNLQQKLGNLPKLNILVIPPNYNLKDLIKFIKLELHHH